MRGYIRGSDAQKDRVLMFVLRPKQAIGGLILEWIGSLKSGSQSPDILLSYASVVSYTYTNPWKLAI